MQEDDVINFNAHLWHFLFMTIKINHIAIWTNDLEKMKDFYVNFFAGNASKKYVNSVKNFESYFIEFQSGTRLELMKGNKNAKIPQQKCIGYSHIAISVGSKEEVNHFTEKFHRNGLPIISQPRVTGDGYYESIICDPEGNLIEITV